MSTCSSFTTTLTFLVCVKYDCNVLAC
jgi:hypothetical protein